MRACSCGHSSKSRIDAGNHDQRIHEKQGTEQSTTTRAAVFKGCKKLAEIIHSEGEITKAARTRKKGCLKKCWTKIWKKQNPLCAHCQGSKSLTRKRHSKNMRNPPLPFETIFLPTCQLTGQRNNHHLVLGRDECRISVCVHVTGLS